MSFPRGVNQTYCSPRMKRCERRERELIDCVGGKEEFVFFSFSQFLISSLIQEVIYFDSYLNEFYFISK